MGQTGDDLGEADIGGYDGDPGGQSLGHREAKRLVCRRNDQYVEGAEDVAGRAVLARNRFVEASKKKKCEFQKPAIVVHGEEGVGKSIEVCTNTRCKVHGTGSSAGESEKEIAARKKREEQKLAALSAAQTLKLQSLMSRGSHRMVMINNTMYQEGDSVDGFVIEKISSTSVVVRQTPFRFELTMNR